MVHLNKVIGFVTMRSPCVMRADLLSCDRLDMAKPLSTDLPRLHPKPDEIGALATNQVAVCCASIRADADRQSMSMATMTSKMQNEVEHADSEKYRRGRCRR